MQWQSSTRLLLPRHYHILLGHIPRSLVSACRFDAKVASSFLARYERALRDQPTLSALASPAAQMTAYALIAGGNVLVLSSMWALGITGTYLGDYFGILMDHRVETFPFNVTGAPMYYGSTLSFLGTALLYAKPAGFLLTLEVLTIYLVALRFEESVPCDDAQSPLC